MDLYLCFLFWYVVLFSVFVRVSAVCIAGTESGTDDVCLLCQEGWFSYGEDEMCRMCPQNQISNPSRDNCGEYSSVNSVLNIIRLVQIEQLP